MWSIEFINRRSFLGIVGVVISHPSRSLIKNARFSFLLKEASVNRYLRSNVMSVAILQLIFTLSCEKFFGFTPLKVVVKFFRLFCARLQKLISLHG